MGTLRLVRDGVELASVPVAASATAAWADSTNTGYRNAPGYPGSLTKGPATPGGLASGQTYKFLDFPGATFGSSSSSLLTGATFIGCRFKAVSVLDALTISHTRDCTFSYCSFEPGVSAPPVPFNSSYQYGFVAGGPYNSQAQGLKLSHCDFWGFGNAIEGCGGSATHPTLIEWCWIHDAAADGGGQYHTDGIGMTDTGSSLSYVTVDHCRIESHGNTNGLAWQSGTYSNMAVTNNLFSGFGYTVAIWGKGSNIRFEDNTYSTRFKPDFGPLYPQSFWTTSGSSWKRNKWLVPAGAEWGNTAHNGWFWIPNAAEIKGSDDTPYVSQADFAG